MVRISVGRWGKLENVVSSVEFIMGERGGGCYFVRSDMLLVFFLGFVSGSGLERRWEGGSLRLIYPVI